MSLLFLVIETRRPTPNRCHRRICIPCYRLHVTCLFIKDKHKNKKAWSQSCCPFHVLKALALPNPSETSNAESPTPMHISNTDACDATIAHSTYDAYKHHVERFPLLCFRRILELARFSERQNQSVQ